MYKLGNKFSLAVLIGRGFDLDFIGFSFFGLFFIQFSGCCCVQVLIYAPLAQLVEHLTLNQGVPGSNP